MEMIKNFYESEIGSAIISILLLSLACFILYRFIMFFVNRLSKKIDPNGLHWKLIKQVVKIICMLLFVLGVVDAVPSLSKIGTALVAFSSVFAAAVGLASQDTLGNAIDGIAISMFKPFNVGDRVRLVSKGITGIVVDINFRYTSIKTVENNVLMIPNSIMNDEIIENSNISDAKIKAFLDVDISYDSSVEDAREVILDLVSKHPLFVDIRTEEEKEKGVPLVKTVVRELGASGVSLRTTVCSANIGDSFSLCSDLREQVLKAFKEKGISIPYQTIEIINHK